MPTRPATAPVRWDATVDGNQAEEQALLDGIETLKQNLDFVRKRCHEEDERRKRQEDLMEGMMERRTGPSYREQVATLTKEREELVLRLEELNEKRKDWRQRHVDLEMQLE